MARTVVDMSGIKSLAAVGTIASGSNSLVLQSNPGFLVNDHIVIEIGGEPGLGAPGTMGVGGSWPALTYATTTALQADGTQPTNAFAWAQDTGLAYQWSGSAWTLLSTLQPEVWNYFFKSIPRAMLAQITSISGTTLTLDSNAQATATTANVYFNNTYPMNALIAANGNFCDYIFPNGTFWFGDNKLVGADSQSPIFVNLKTSTLISGQGASTILCTPKGATCWTIHVNESPGTVIRDLTMQGNFTLTGGWGFDYKFSQQGTSGSLTNVGAAPGIPVGINPHIADFVRVTDVEFVNCARCVASNFSTNSAVYRCSHTIDGQLAYIQWMYDWVDSFDCWTYDCSSTSTYLTKCFECFGTSTFCGHKRPTTVNGVFALNGVTNCTIDTPTVTITALSQYQPGTVFTVTIGNPIFDVNTNIGPGSGGNQILNMNVVQQGYINANQDILIGANAGSNGHGLIVDGGTFSAPNYSGNGNLGPLAANADATDTGCIVRNLTATGTPNVFWGNINVQNGQIIGCTAPQIVCPGPNCVLS